MKVTVPVVLASALGLGFVAGTWNAGDTVSTVALADPPVATAPVSGALPPSSALPAEQLYVRIADLAVPSVANIYTTQQLRPRSRGFNPWGGWPIPGQPDGGQGQGWGGDWGYGDSGPAARERPQSLGTGFVFEKDGDTAYLLTNHHVIDQADQVYVKFTEKSDEPERKAVVVGSDPELDVAVLKVSKAGDVKPLVLGDSDGLRVGEWVAAIGNPFGHGHSMTHGIVSAKARNLPGGWGRYLQTDTPINPGNSGGPLLNLRGEVVGINNAIDARGPGIGFAIPANSVKKILADLKSGGSVERGYIGISMAPIEASPIREREKFPPSQPVVAQVAPGEPAARAGLQPYDIILEAAGKKVSTTEELLENVTNAKVGSEIEIKVERNGKVKNFGVKVAKRPTRAQQR